MSAAALLCAASLASVVRWRWTARCPLWGTIVVNLVGSFAIGVFYSRGVDSPVLTVGALGSLTTVSGAVVDAGALSKKTRAFYVVVTVVGAVGGSWLGLQMA